MSLGRILKRIHFASTIWFTLCSCYILVASLRSLGKSWWVIVSLSGHSVLIMLLLISFYLFAVFRGASSHMTIEIEHPLTSSIYYLAFYDIAPFLGALFYGLRAIGINNLTDYWLMVAAGSFWTTFFVWIILDPVIGFGEILLPSARRHRQQRLDQAKVMREKELLAKQRLLAEAQNSEKQEWIHRGQVLQPYAAKLASLVTGSEPAAGENMEREVVDIGLSAWQMGGLNCMRRLHSMAMEICEEKCRNADIIDYISTWWDGIGSWQDPHFS